MSETWFYLESNAGDPAANMALDEALLESAPQRPEPVLRFYSWNVPAATFGYSQKYEEIARATLLRPLIRRPTGGGLVPHDADWTYSVVFPRGHFWYELNAEESYRQLHEWIKAAFANMGVETMLSQCCQKEVPGQCFRGAEKHDLLWHGRKIAGAAQRRAKVALLIQGSVQPPPIRLQRATWEKAMRETAGERWNVTWKEFAVDEPLNATVSRLVTEKFGNQSFNEKR